MLRSEAEDLEAHSLDIDKIVKFDQFIESLQQRREGKKISCV